MDRTNHLRCKLWLRGRERAFAELTFSLLLDSQLSGFVPAYWRPPYGDVDSRESPLQAFEVT